MKLFKKRRGLTRRQKAIRSLVIMIIAVVLAQQAGAPFGLRTSKFRALREMESRLCIPYTHTIKEFEYRESPTGSESEYYRFARAEDVLVLSRLRGFGSVGRNWFCSDELTGYIAINENNPITRVGISSYIGETVEIHTAGIISDSSVSRIILFYDFKDPARTDVSVPVTEYFTHNGERYFYCTHSFTDDRANRGDWTLLCYDENDNMIFDFEKDNKFY